MKILVTGGNGQLGRSLKKVSGEFPNHEFVFADRQEMDITDERAVENFIVRSGAQAIVNCAAFTAVDWAEGEPVVAEKINRYGAKVLASMAVKYGLKLIYISTDYVFDGSVGRPLREDDEVNPLGVYGRTKLEGEHEVRKSGADAVVIRTSWLYSEFGESNFVKTMLRVSNNVPTLKVVSDQYGSPTYATDLARAIVGIIDRGVAGFDIYNYSNEGCVTRYEFAKEIFRLAGKQVDMEAVPIEYFRTNAKRPLYSALDVSKIRSVGVEVPSWKDSLRSCIEEILL